jgi:hypothetical protein
MDSESSEPPTKRRKTGYDEVTEHDDSIHALLEAFYTCDANNFDGILFAFEKEMEHIKLNLAEIYQNYNHDEMKESIRTFKIKWCRRQKLQKLKLECINDRYTMPDNMIAEEFVFYILEKEKFHSIDNSQRIWTFLKKEFPNFVMNFDQLKYYQYDIEFWILHWLVPMICENMENRVQTIVREESFQEINPIEASNVK